MFLKKICSTLMVLGLCLTASTSFAVDLGWSGMYFENTDLTSRNTTLTIGEVYERQDGLMAFTYAFDINGEIHEGIATIDSAAYDNVQSATSDLFYFTLIKGGLSKIEIDFRNNSDQNYPWIQNLRNMYFGDGSVG